MLSCVQRQRFAKHQVLRELKRVVKPGSRGGRVLLLENSRPKNGLLGAYVDATASAVAKTGGKGCDYSQDPRGAASCPRRASRSLVLLLSKH